MPYSRFLRPTFAILLLRFLLPAHAAPPAFIPGKLRALDAAVTNAIAQHKLPGAVLWLEHHTHAYARAYGRRAVEPQPEAMTTDTVFDAASLTKVIATTPSVMLLLERGMIQLDEPARAYLPNLADGAEGITVRHLLTHTSGLRPGIGATPEWEGYDRGIERAAREQPRTPPGTAFRYSDINFILLGELVRVVSGASLDDFAAREIFMPLGMTNTAFLPPEQWIGRIAPTTKADENYLRGKVHDPTARRMGGVAGHAGLFTTAADLARFARMMLGDGALGQVRLFQPNTVRLMTSIQSPPAVAESRGLGWDIDSPYATSLRGSHFPAGSYGHSGWTGTSIWIDPYSQTFLILLSNRNHPTESGAVVALRREVATLAAEALVGYGYGIAPPTPPLALGPEVAPQVLNGIDVLVRDEFAPLKKRRLGLITNHTGTDYRRRSTIDLLRGASNVTLKVLFSPEHGLRGTRDEHVEDGVDERSGLPVYSLYGERKAPSSEQLRDLDALVFDIQDIGCRFYTYISTLGLCLEAAARHDLPFFVLDRVNPINGVTVDGPVHRGASEFIAFHALPLRHGMTLGELAQMFNDERGIGADLTVIPLSGWRREMWFDETGLPWINPSPNMRSLTEAILYPGVGLLEFAISVGRGTDTPFELTGAPFVGDRHFAQRLNEAGIPGVRFLPIQFTPSASVFQKELCGGVRLVLTDRERCPVIDIGLAAAQILHQTYGTNFSFEKFNRLLLDTNIVEDLKQNRPVEQIRAAWQSDLQQFMERREKYLKY